MILEAVSLLTGPIAALLDKVIPDKDERERLAHEIATLAERQSHEIRQLQIKNNTTEAAHKSLFVAGWRPFIGWVCGISLANNYLLAPYVTAFSDTTVPVLDLAAMTPILTGMLGLAAYRSYEKKNGVAREK